MIDILALIGKFLFSLGLSVGLGITFTVFALIVLTWIVDTFRLNRKGNPMWVINICLGVFCISIISILVHLMRTS